MSYFEIVMASLTAIYVGATIFYAVVSYHTLTTIQKEGSDNAERFDKQLTEATKIANAARDSANAAQVSADALINSERPWIVISSIQRSTEQRGIPDDPGRKYPHFSVDVTFKNYGKTPAVIRRVSGGLDIVSSLSHDYATMEEPDSPIFGPVLAPNEESGRIKFVMSDPFTEDQKNKVNEGIALFILGGGLVEYSDSFNRGHTSRFCYIWDSRRSAFCWLCHNNRHNEYT